MQEEQATVHDAVHLMLMDFFVGIVFPIHLYLYLPMDDNHSCDTHEQRITKSQ